MAATVTDTISLFNNQQQCLSAEFNVDYSNCILLKEQLNYALLELDSAKQSSLFFVIIVTNSTKQTSSSKLSSYEPNDEKWLSVCHGFNKKMKRIKLT